ncbi:hypothetical protein Bbelb_387930 [Branchiostoma belcheri]|nr:hypothetical protein Bbelb_387930 [Branchiostoma belcheri]
MYEEAEPVRTPQAGSDRKQPSHDPPGRLGNTNGHVHRGKQACHEYKGGQGTSSNVYEEAEVVKLKNISGDVPYGTDTSTDTETTQHVGARVYCMVAALAVVVALAITGPILLMFINGGYNHEEDISHVPTTVGAFNLEHKQNQTAAMEQRLTEKTGRGTWSAGSPANLEQRTGVECRQPRPTARARGKRVSRGPVNFAMSHPEMQTTAGIHWQARSPPYQADSGDVPGGPELIRNTTGAAAQCPLLSPPLHGSVSDCNSYGDVVHFTCEQGYRLVGKSSLTCFSDGTWNGNSPKCTELSTQTDSQLLQKDVNTLEEWQSKWLMQFNPEEFYIMHITNKRTPHATSYQFCGQALATTKAHPYLSVTLTSAVQCALLSPLLHGSVSGSNSYGDVVHFTCEQGYRLIKNGEGPKSISHGYEVLTLAVDYYRLDAVSWDLPASCPTNGQLSLPNGKRYVAPSDEQVDYATAQSRCAAEGGTVALPLDSNEQAYLVFFKNCLNQHAQFWVGVSRPDGTWVDSQGSALGGFSAWAPGEPDYPPNLCSHLVFGARSDSERRNKWADAPCSTSFRYICKTSCETARTDTVYRYRWEQRRLAGSRFTFAVQADNDAHVALSAQRRDLDDMYEIVIGGWANTWSVIRRSKQGKHHASALTLDGTIAVGKGGKTQPFMKWRDPNPLPIAYAGYSTGWGSTGRWKFCHNAHLAEGRGTRTYTDTSSTTYTYRGNRERV